jgi:DNA-binding transcriptional LysR family regulator
MNDSVQFGFFDTRAVETFLLCCETMDGSSREELTSLRKLLLKMQDLKYGVYSTLLNHLHDLVSFLTGRTGTRFKTNRLELTLLFEETTVGLKLTPFAGMLRKRLTLFHHSVEELCREASQVIDHRSSRKIRIGAPSTLAHRLLANVFSYPPAIFGSDSPDVSIEIVIGNSQTDLVHQLKLGLINLLVSYGRETVNEHESTDYREDDIGKTIYFHDFGFRPDMILLAHPMQDIPLTNGQSVTGLQPIPDCSAITFPNEKKKKTINLYDVDFRRVTLIAIPSWRQPKALLEIMSRAKRENRLREVSKYDDALALVRAKGGISVVSRAFTRRERVRVFELSDAHQFRRPVGIYYDATQDITIDEIRCIEFLRAYVNRYGNDFFEQRPAIVCQDGKSKPKGQVPLHRFPFELDYQISEEWIKASTFAKQLQKQKNQRELSSRPRAESTGR